MEGSNVRNDFIDRPTLRASFVLSLWLRRKRRILTCPHHTPDTHIKWHVRGYIAFAGIEIWKCWYQRWSCLEASYKGSVSSSFLT